jgi:hypothetical protein
MLETQPRISERRDVVETKKRKTERERKKQNERAM